MHDGRRRTLGTGQVQTGELSRFYPGTAWAAHGNYGVEYDLTLPLVNDGRSRNAVQAQAFGLRWVVHTDHGGPGHSAVTRDHAYPALLQARADGVSNFAVFCNHITIIPTLRAILAFVAHEDVPVVGTDVVPRLGGVGPRRHCHHAMKMVMLREAGFTAPVAVAYTDSSADLPLLQAAAQPVVVNPKPSRVAMFRRVLPAGTPILNWGCPGRGGDPVG